MISKIGSNDFIPLNDLPGAGMVIDYDDLKTGVIHGYAIDPKQGYGLVVEQITELEHMAIGNNCPACKGVEHLKKSYEASLSQENAPVQAQPLTPTVAQSYIDPLRIRLVNVGNGTSFIELDNPMLSEENGKHLGLFLKALSNNLVIKDINSNPSC